MTISLSASQLFRQRSVTKMRWLPVLAGLIVLYAPTFFDLSRGMWTRDEYMHGPIVLAVVIWLIWQLRDQLWNGGEEVPRPYLGVACASMGALLYILGRSQDIIIFEVGSIIPMLAGILLAMCGGISLRRFRFPLLFLLFMLPLPGMIVDALTGPLKQQVSAIAENLLYHIGYPIARTGVVLLVGPYQLLVADACSGLHSLISMSAMGLLYIHLMKHDNIVRNLILVSVLLPIAFAANVARVMVLVLVTYHWGDEAGQGFIHDFSGIFLFVVGLMLLFGIDAVLGKFQTLQSTFA